MPTKQQSPVLLATDQGASVLHYLGAGYARPIAYTPFGFHIPEPGGVLSGFNGHVFERMTLGYLLGNGYRHFSPAQTRFPSPDDLSPFDEGGLNAYVYCKGDPQNYTDPSGHANIWKGIKNLFGRQSSIAISKELQRANRAVKIGPKGPLHSISSTIAKSSQDAASAIKNITAKGAPNNWAEVAPNDVLLGKLSATPELPEAQLTREQLMGIQKQFRQAAKAKKTARAELKQAWRADQWRKWLGGNLYDVGIAKIRDKKLHESKFAYLDY